MGHSNTGRGKASPLPSIPIQLEPLTRQLQDGSFEVLFTGLDGRKRNYRTAKWPLAYLHEAVCHAFAESTGFDGRLRTERSATGIWGGLRRVIFFLATLDTPPSRWSDISAADLTKYAEFRLGTVGYASVRMEMHALRRILDGLPDQDRINSDAGRYLSRRWALKKSGGVGGYSPQVFNAVMAAARSDVARVRQRIAVGEKLLSTFRTDPESLTAEDREIGSALDRLDSTGEVGASGVIGNAWSARLGTARRLLLTYEDLVPFLVLFVGLHTRNIETVKELPASHTMLDGRAIELIITKRRRGAGEWTEIVTWDAGKRSRELQSEGSMYQLIHRLTQRGRIFSGSDKLWVVWTNGQMNGKLEAHGHHFAWSQSLSQAPLFLSEWASSHSLKENGEPLLMSFNRIRTSALVRQTRELGGHLPSAAKSNTQNVLFSSYLTPDATMKDWGEGIVSETFSEIEIMVRNERDRLLGDARRIGDPLNDFSDDPSVVTETGYLGCVNVLRSPFDQDGECSQTALVCFSCPNAVVSESNLSSLLALRDELAEKFETLEKNRWWGRYGAVWVAIHEDILPRFSPQEIELASAGSTPSVPMRFLEGSWEA